MRVHSSRARRIPDRRVIAVTAGDPCGVGPEVILKALVRLPARVRSRLLVIGDHTVFARTARRLKLPVPSWVRREWPLSDAGIPRGLTIVDCDHGGSFQPGQSSPAAGAASLAYLDHAIALWRRGCLQALVTGPVTKWAIAHRRRGFVGQTEYLARAMGARDVAMLFISDSLRVALVTRHVPIRRVAAGIDRGGLGSVIRLTARALGTSFRIRRPRVAVCGLNPHAGERGALGREERDVVIPAIRAARRSGIRCEGPFAADGFFAAPTGFDAIVCCYHDQGLIPFKLLARDRGCQMTVGLPIVRTAPDHGSALGIAGRGLAHPGAMGYAIRLAARLGDSEGC